MTSEELAAIKARAEAATPGPWKRSDEESGDYYAPGWSVEAPIEVGSMSLAVSIDDKPDAEFIAHARTDVPALVAAVEDLRWLLSVIGEQQDGAWGNLARMAAAGTMDIAATRKRWDPEAAKKMT